MFGREADDSQNEEDDEEYDDESDPVFGSKKDESALA